MTVALDVFTSSVDRAEEFARKLRANVTDLSTDMAAINGRLADAVFAQGNCSALSHMYQDVYAAMCGDAGAKKKDTDTPFI